MRRFLVAVALAAILHAPATAAERPRLVVLVVFDQLRGDYLERWGPLFGDDGFNRLLKDGAWFTNCHYPYATTATGPGHASMLTGCAPDVHGIVQNEWYDRKTAKVVNCAESDRYRRVPPLPEKLPPDEPITPPKTEEKKASTSKPRVKLAGSPDWLLAPTLGDALKEQSGGKARVVGLSFKDRSALLPVGKGADAAYWLDSADGMIVTSSFYRDSPHPWVAELNKERVADRWFDKTWERLRPDLDYAKYSGPDEVAGEGKGIKQGLTFPHPMNGGLKRPGKAYYDALFNSPFGNDFLLELVRRAVVAEQLGRHEATDLLVVSFSSTDAVGHSWGPDSQEALDTALRADRVLASFLSLLDAEAGKGKYALVLTADHGVCPLPEVTAKGGTFARRVPGKKVFAAAEEHLNATFGKDEPADAKARWIENVTPPWASLNLSLIESRGLKPETVAKELADFLAKQEGFYRTFTRADLADDFPLNDPIGRRVRRSYFPDRCGDVGFVLAPYCLLVESAATATGTNHGSPHPYDTHVPLLAYGPGVKPGKRKDAVTPLAAAAILARAAGVKPPAKAAEPVPEGLFDGE
jgi:predicted AlkP superfamily pyrophosphatase or phosphodiesterase